MEEIKAEKERKKQLLELNLTSQQKSAFTKWCNMWCFWHDIKLKWMEYAPIEERHRCTYTTIEMHKKYKSWKVGEKHYYYWTAGDDENKHLTYAKSSGKAKIKAANEIGCSFIEVRVNLCFNYSM